MPLSLECLVPPLVSQGTHPRHAQSPLTPQAAQSSSETTPNDPNIGYKIIERTERANVRIRKINEAGRGSVTR